MALRYADYGYILENGRVVMDGEARALRENEDVKEFYLGMGGGDRKSFRDVKSYRRRKRWSPEGRPADDPAAGRPRRPVRGRRGAGAQAPRLRELSWPSAGRLRAARLKSRGAARPPEASIAMVRSTSRSPGAAGRR
jgi:hypothetical protein